MEPYEKLGLESDNWYRKDKIGIESGNWWRSQKKPSTFLPRVESITWIVILLLR